MIIMATPEQGSTFLEKHKPLTREDIEKKQIEARQSKTKYTKDIQEVESNLMNFLNRADPMVNPETEEILCWIKQIPISELTSNTPAELKTLILTAKTPEEAEEIVKKYREEHPQEDMTDSMYILMEKMITIPRKTAQEWKEVVNPEFSALFEITVAAIYKRMAEQISFF